MSAPTSARIMRTNTTLSDATSAVRLTFALSIARQQTPILCLLFLIKFTKSRSGLGTTPGLPMFGILEAQKQIGLCRKVLSVNFLAISQKYGVILRNRMNFLGN